MTVYKDKQRGTYYYVFKAKNPVTGKVSWTKQRGFKTKRDALNAEADARRKDTSNTGSMTFLEMAEKQMDAIESSDSMRAIKLTHFKQRFADFQDLQIKNIKAAQLVEWRAELSKNDKYAYRTKNTTVQFVRAVFVFANRFYGLPSLEHALPPLKRPRVIQEEKQVWTVEEFNQFQKNVENELYRKFFIFLYWTGCRRGEAMALHKSDINLSDSTATIAKSIKHFQNGETPTKTGKSRKIHLNRLILREIKPFMEDPEGIYLFGGERTLSITCIQREFEKAKKSCPDINQNVTIHGLRHSFATNAISAGANIIAVSKHLGHSSIEITLNTYSHLLQQTSDQMDEIIEKISK